MPLLGGSGHWQFVRTTADTTMCPHCPHVDCHQWGTKPCQLKASRLRSARGTILRMVEAAVAILEVPSCLYLNRHSPLVLYTRTSLPRQEKMFV
ncbi:hypothetical protein AB205_0212150 [Aquarana catesbeiana]|uniref:Uncharacterized protein n=1 Tax=Aquarana catesbeiana TaxID=8400 RepID=A0A2G9RKA5_AQUCT|nr:hypothetical protein AB205_0212150 [Aquarana catesbeiana]